MALKENYKDDILDVSVNTKRKYRMTENPDGTISLEDETVYTQQGDSFGASDLNAMAHAINNTSSDAEHTSYDNTTSGLVSDNVQGAIDEVVEEFEQTPIEVGGETLSTIDDKLNYLLANKIAINDLLALSEKIGSISLSDSYTSDFNGQILIVVGCYGYKDDATFTSTIKKNNVNQNDIIHSPVLSALGAMQLFIYLIDVNVNDVISISVSNNLYSAQKEGIISGIYKLQ